MTLLHEPAGRTQSDLGTPAVPGEPTVEIEVDGIAVAVPEGTSIMRAAAEAGIDIPKLCATDSLKSFGSCRVCLVEIEGRPGTPASCTTPVTPGMKVATSSPTVEKLRRGVVELYLSDHPADSCADGACELHAMAETVGLTDVRYGQEGHDHLNIEVDASNPYFTIDPKACIVCSRCVRACDEIQGTLALTVQGRGFESLISASGTSFMESECVSCGACVQACPTTALQEKSVIELGLPTRTVKTTCAYCGVGCSFDAELRGDELVRMTPGRFAWGYATHDERVTVPMVRESIDDEWREVSWDEAISFTAERFKALQAQYGPDAIGGITSSRCTNEEVFVVQKMVRAAFGNNNVDTCARVCHSPTGYGLKTTFGTSAGTQDFKSVEQADVIMVIGANPTDAHPVFGSRMKQRLRKGAGLIVVDPRKTDLVRSPHIEAHHHLQLMPGTNVAVINALAHVVVTEGLVDRGFVADRCEADSFAAWETFIASPENSPEATEAATGVPASELRAAARMYASAPNAAIYYGLGVTEHSQGSTMVMGMANLAMATGNIGREGVGVNPLRGQNNVQGSCDMGSFPHEFSGYRHVSDDTVRVLFEDAWGTQMRAEPGLRIPNMFDAAIAGTFRGLFVQGEDVAQSDPNIAHVHAALRSLDLLVVQDLFLNETAKFAHVFFPGTSFLEKDGTFTNAERRINRVRPVMEPKTGKDEWRVACEISTAMGYPMHYDEAAQIMDEIARVTPTFAGVSFEHLDRVGSVQWPCNAAAPEGTPIMHVDGFVRGLGHFARTPYVPTDEKANRKFPLLLTTGRILSQYNVGAQTRRTANVEWHHEDVLELHEADAEERGIKEGDWVALASRVGETHMRAHVSDRVPQGVVYTTFHHPESGANVVTTEYSDWATNCPEYKVTAVQIRPANADEPAWDTSGPAHDIGLDDLVRMADQIARNQAYRSDDEAVSVVANHIRLFWAPAMQRDLLDALASGRAELTPVARRAMEQLQPA